MTKDGRDLLNDPIRNRGTGFTEAERNALGLRGLLPPMVETLEQQVARVERNFAHKATPLGAYIFLMALQDQNETLFYRSVLDHLESALPIIYTPTVGEAAQKFGAIFRRPRGLYVTLEDRGSVADVLRNWPEHEVRVIVVTDGGRILGLGDLGANGMSISIGKLALYTAAGGIPPQATLPITIDVGTDNEELRASEFYLGLKRPRCTGSDYLELMDEFVAAVKVVFPEALLQFEDFKTERAIELLDRYRDDTRTFNDDIQGTAGVTLAGLHAASRITGGRLSEQTILFVGAGAANTGIGDLVAAAIAAEEGVPVESARAHCWFVDSRGLIVDGRSGLRPYKLPYAHAHAEMTDLVEMIESLRPSVLIGATGKRGIFSREVVEAMGRVNEQPVIFALSNPTSRSEATAEEVYGWSEGRAVFASGSPFDPVTVNGRTHVPGQSNNVYIFPGVGLGVMAFGITRVTEAMFLAAARAVAETLPTARLEAGALFPAMSSIRDVSVAIAGAVGVVAYADGLANTPRPKDLEERARSVMYLPSYQERAR